MGPQTYELWAANINGPVNLSIMGSKLWKGLQTYELRAANINELSNMNYGLYILQGLQTFMKYEP